MGHSADTLPLWLSPIRFWSQKTRAARFVRDFGPPWPNDGCPERSHVWPQASTSTGSRNPQRFRPEVRVRRSLFLTAFWVGSSWPIGLTDSEQLGDVERVATDPQSHKDWSCNHPEVCSCWFMSWTHRITFLSVGKSTCQWIQCSVHEWVSQNDSTWAGHVLLVRWSRVHWVNTD